VTINRRGFLAGAAGLALAAPAISLARDRPVAGHGVQSGDVDMTSGVIWARADRPARAFVEVSTSGRFENAIRLAPVDVLAEGDFTMKRLVTGLPSGQEIFYRVVFENLGAGRARSAPVTGRFRTAPSARRNVRLAWSADTAGQGYGIDTGRGGMLTYAAIASHEPDFFVHCGDTIYADAPISQAHPMPGGGTWNNLVAEGVDKVAETLAEFRGRFKYNLLDEHLRAMNARIPTFAQWSDHEVVDNWSDAADLAGDERYRVKDIRLLAARARRAFGEMMPIRHAPTEPGRIYRKIAYGPLLDVFFLDLRSYRGPNGASMETRLTDAARILGADQLAWLKRALEDSKATWKIIASDLPIGTIIWEDWRSKRGVEAVANGDNGPPRGRELEFADLLRHIMTRRIENVVWLTADVHYTAAHHYHPDRAAFADFKPFWEFVSGPLHAGTFGPNALDMTFGPEVRFVKAPAPEQGVNLPPSGGLQFFGLVDVEGATGQMTVRLMDRANAELYRVTLDPE
jgi:alkaline phosphatase D